jgi:hypothetical protein
MFKYDILENTELGIQKQGTKTFYNVDGQKKSSEWVREPLKGLKTKNCPQMTSAVKYRNEVGNGKVTQNHIGYMLSNANSIQSNDTNVALFSTGIYKGHGFSITAENFKRVVTLFSARKLVLSNWLNEKDEYFAPNENHPKFEQFYVDSIVYSLFNNSSEQSALSNIHYQNQIWNIPNEFFWMSNDEIIEISGQVFNHEIMEQRTQSERFVFIKLFGDEKLYEKLSDDAKLVLDIATQFVRDTFIYRNEYSDYENQAYNWDSGYSQLKKLWKQKFPNDFENFRKTYKNLEERMRPLVYELGFLMK